MKINVMALTAGTGTRLLPYTLSLSKPAIPFLGVPMVFHALRHLECMKVETLVANLHHRPTDVRDLLTSHQDRYPFQITFSDESKLLLGSGGAISKARDTLMATEHFVVFNGDEVFLPATPNFLQKALEYHSSNNNLATLITMNHKEVGKNLGGAWVDENNQVVRFSKKAVPDLLGLHYIGYAIISRNVFQYFNEELVEENLLYETLSKAMAVGERVYAFKTTGHWFETGSPQHFIAGADKLIDLLKQNDRSEWAKNFVKFLVQNKPFSYVVEKHSPEVAEKVRKFLEGIA